MEGLGKAFYTINSVILGSNWFHSRDFVYMCRMLRRLIQTSMPSNALFDADMLLSVLRRHFQPLDSTDFPAIARHFLKCCNLLDQSDTGTIDLSARVVESLRLSVEDSLDEHANPTEAHCRYTLVIDPTDSEASIDLLFAMKFLDAAQTKVVELSDFPDDSTTTQRTAVLAQIKKVIETGGCLLLKNSAPLQSALYDVINRHYAISVREEARSDESEPKKIIRDAYAVIALGSFSRYVRVHPSFRLVIHVPRSQLYLTPLPFLNRLEKYPFSISDALQMRINEIALRPPNCLQGLGRPQLVIEFFKALRAGVDHFVEFLGGSHTLYGHSPHETVSALILSSIGEEALSISSEYQPQQSALSLVYTMFRAADNAITGRERSNWDMHPPTDLPTEGLSHAEALYKRLPHLIRCFNKQLLETARVENIFKLCRTLPKEYIAEFIDRQEHFSVIKLLKTLLGYSTSTNTYAIPPIKQVIYTRTGTMITLRLFTH